MIKGEYFNSTVFLFKARKDSIAKAQVTKHPEVVDDFVRNFLVRMGMERTLDCFQTEW